MVTIMTGGKVSMDAIFPRDVDIVVDVAGETEVGIIPYVVIGFVTGPSSYDETNQKERPTVEEKNFDTLQPSLHLQSSVGKDFSEKEYLKDEKSSKSKSY